LDEGVTGRYNLYIVDSQDALRVVYFICVSFACMFLVLFTVVFTGEVSAMWVQLAAVIHFLPYLILSLVVSCWLAYVEFECAGSSTCDDTVGRWSAVCGVVVSVGNGVLLLFDTYHTYKHNQRVSANGDPVSVADVPNDVVGDGIEENGNTGEGEEEEHGHRDELQLESAVWATNTSTLDTDLTPS
jgi:hypothetical protein